MIEKFDKNRSPASEVNTPFDQKSDDFREALQETPETLAKAVAERKYSDATSLEKIRQELKYSGDEYKRSDTERVKETVFSAKLGFDLATKKSMPDWNIGEPFRVNFRRNFSDKIVEFDSIKFRNSYENNEIMHKVIEKLEKRGISVEILEDQTAFEISKDLLEDPDVTRKLKEFFQVWESDDTEMLCRELNIDTM